MTSYPIWSSFHRMNNLVFSESAWGPKCYSEYTESQRRWNFSFQPLGIFLLPTWVLSSLLSLCPFGWNNKTIRFPEPLFKLNNQIPSFLLFIMCSSPSAISFWPPARWFAVVWCCKICSSHCLLIYLCFFHYPAVQLWEDQTTTIFLFLLPLC